MPAGSDRHFFHLSVDYRKFTDRPTSQSSVVVKEGRESIWSTCVRVLEGHTSYRHCIAFSPDGGELVSGFDDNTVRVWDVQTGALLQVIKGHHERVTSVTYSPDGTLCCFGFT